VDPNQVFCLERTSLVLPVEGAPLVFSTGLAHDFAVRVQTANGSTIELPAVADAARGGFVVDSRTSRGVQLMSPSSGKLHGFWGYEPFAGPNFDLRSAHAGKWSVAEADKNALIIGRDDTLHLQSDNATCVEDVILRDQHGKEIQATWKLLKPEGLEVRIPLQEASPGPVSLLLKRSGITKPTKLHCRHTPRRPT
jgi:hypothetical protein